MLPEFKQPISGYPTLMIIASQPGVGKSSLFPSLNVNGYKCLHIDLQGGTAHVGGYIIDVNKYAHQENISIAQALFKYIKAIREEDAKNNKHTYDFVVIDPLSSLKSIIEILGTKKFNESLVGKAQAKKIAEEMYGKNASIAQIDSCKSKNVISDIGQNGWNYMNTAWLELFKDLRSLAGICTFFIAHTKYNTLKKSSLQEFSVKEIDFWPSYLLHLIGEASDSCIAYRKENKVIANFKLEIDQEHFKSRNFDGEEIVLSTKEGKEIKTYWENIFPFISTKKID